MDAGETPVVQAAVMKFLGARFEQDVAETARWLLADGSAPDEGGLRAMLVEAELALPGISLRGGASEILAGIIARGARQP
jgi:hypothetical protein